MNEKMKLFGLVIIGLFLSFTMGYGQITYFGEVIDYDTKNNLAGVSVRVLLNGSEVARTTSSGGKYSVSFDPGKTYHIVYSKAGYVSKFIKVDVTKVLEEEMPPGGKIFPSINIDLFTTRSGADFSFLDNQAVAEWYFDRDRMNFDAKKVSQMKKKIADKLQEAEDATANSEAQYNALIAEADQLFDKKEYEAAMNKYVAAIKVPGKEAEKHPNSRIVEIGDILQKQAEDELSYQQENQEYLNLIAAGDNLAASNQFDKAIDKYEEALSLNPNEQYPKDRINELKAIKLNEKKQKEYEELIKLADMFYKQKSLETARDKYQEASELLPNESYPKAQLEKLVGEIEKLSAIKEQKDKYNQAIEEGDAFYDKEEWEQAIEKYQEALEIESAAAYPAERITMAEGKIQELKEEQEKLDNFNRLVEEGDQHVGSKEYQEAISKYTQALDLIDDNGVKQKRTTAQQLLEEQLANAEKQQAFDDLVAAGDENVENKNYENAIAKYDEALTIFDDNEVKSKRQNAMDLLTQQKENEEKLEAFNAFVKEGDDAMDSKEYQNAIHNYSEALKLIDDTGVKEKQQQAQQLLDEQIAEAEKENRFNQLVAEGDGNFTSKNYQQAIEKYDDALALIEDNEVKDKRNQAQELWDEKKANEEKEDAYNRLVQEGDEQLNESNFQVAINKYTEASEIINNQEIQEKIATAERLLEQQIQNAEKQAQINELLASADANMTSKEYESAISTYQEVIDLIGNDAVGITGVNKDYQRAVDGKAEAEKLLANAAELAQKEEEFANLVEKGDSEFDNENWQESRTNYLAAKEIFSDREHVNNRLDEISNILNEIDRQNNINAEIQVLLDQAANLKMDNKWGQVVQKYEEALSLDNTRDDVAELLAGAKQSKEEWDAQQSIEQQFEQLKQDGKTFMAQEKWEESINKFNEALEIKEDEEIRGFLTTIEQKLEDLANLKEQNEAYQAKMDEGEAFVSEEKYEDAIESFKEALSIKENDAIARSRIQDVNALIAQKENQEQAYQRYLQAMQAGNEALGNQDYALAIKSFDDALEIKPSDEEALSKKEIAENEIRKLQSEEAQYQSLIDKGQEFFDEAVIKNNDIPTFEKAKLKYQEAHNLRPDASLPQSKIVEIDNLIRQLNEDKEAELASLEKRYQEYIDLSNVAGQNKNYSEAINYLESALELKPDEDYPKQKIKEYQDKLAELSAELEHEAAYSKLIEKGDRAFNSKDYEESIDFYQQALNVKENEIYPQEQIGKAQRAIENLAQASKEQQFQSLINKADALFDNKEYEESLEKYQEALTIIENDNYAKDKVDEINQILANLREKEAADAASEAKYQSFIAEADQLFNEEEYLEAKKSYEKALGVKPNDVYAIERAQLCVVKSKEKTEKEDDLLYQKILTKADSYFDDEDYNKAEELYNRAIKLRSYDQYPKDKIAEIRAIENANIKEHKGIEYLGIKSDISILEGAALLEQGAKLREQLKHQRVEDQLRMHEGIAEDLKMGDYDERMTYQGEVKEIIDRRDQIYIDEIDQHRDFVKEVEIQEQSFEGLVDEKIAQDKIERHGVEDEIGVLIDRRDQIYIDEIDQHRDFVKKVEIQEQSFEGLVDGKIAQDKIERHGVEDEVNLLIDRRDETLLEEKNQHSDLIKELDLREQEIEKQAQQLNNFERGDIVRTYQDLTYTDDEMDLAKSAKSQDHTMTIQRLKHLEEARDDQYNAELKKHNVGVIATADELLKTEKRNENLYEVNREKQRNLEVKVESIEKGRELRTFEYENENYDKILKLEGEALLTEIKTAEAHRDKSIVTDRLRDDIYALDATIQRKVDAETRNTYEAQLSVDKKLTEVDKKYTKMQENKDDSRQLTVEELKRLNYRSELQAAVNAEKLYQEVQTSTKEIEMVLNFQDEQAKGQREDLAYIDRQMKRQEENFETDKRLRDDEELAQRHRAINELEKITKEEERTKDTKSEEIKEIYEDLKGLEAQTESAKRGKDALHKDENFNTQELINKLENNSITFSPNIANSIGDEYPEGVSQENYVRKDKDGIPIKIVTRRFVVTDGHGDIFIRIQTRNGLTYSKNGTPITEQAWINGTENAKLKKNY